MIAVGFSMKRQHRLRTLAVVVAAIGLGWWWLSDRPSPLSGGTAPARALSDYIDAARRGDCASVFGALSARSQALAAALTPRLIVEKAMCEYSPATAKLPDFETNRIRVERVFGSAAQVSASYTYDRFFGFFGRGRDRYTYALVLEDGRWRVDLTESLDRESRPNQDRRAMFLVQQHRSTRRMSFWRRRWSASAFDRPPARWSCSRFRPSTRRPPISTVAFRPRATTSRSPGRITARRAASDDDNACRTRIRGACASADAVRRYRTP
jgi:hypothetical protein